MTPDRGEYLIAFDSRLSITVRIFSASPTTTTAARLASNVIIRAMAASFCSRSTRRTTSASGTGPSVAGSSARDWWYASRSSISFCSDNVFSRTMRTISCCSGVSRPPTLSRNSSTPSRTAVSGVLSSCDTWRRNRVCCCSSSFKRVRNHSSRWPT